MTTNLKCVRHSHNTTNVRSHLDVSSAHVHAVADTPQLTELPLEDWRDGDTGMVGLLQTSTHVTLEAESTSEVANSLLFKGRRFRREREGESASGNLFCRERSISVVVHCDDFFAVGPRRIPRWCVAGENENCRMGCARQGVSRCGRAGPRGQASEDAFSFLDVFKD